MEHLNDSESEDIDGNILELSSNLNRASKLNNDGKTDYNDADLEFIKEQHAKLISSLTAMTTHFAHVQFRLRQVIDAPVQNKELLLKDLEEFTFKGVSDYQTDSKDTQTDADKIKDQVILQLKNQIVELESSIRHLQKNVSFDKQDKEKLNEQQTDIIKTSDYNSNCEEKTSEKKLSAYISIVRKLLVILRLVNVQNNKDNLKKDLLKKKAMNHWGDVRAQLEFAIADVMELAKEPGVPIDSDYMSDSEGSSYYNQKLATSVRKKLAPAIQNLIQHGLISDNKSVSVANGLTAIIGCVPQAGSSYKYNGDGHAWELILKYYSMKNGDQFNSAPALKLSQSFNLDVGGSFRNTSVQKLLVTIGNIVTTHTQFKRGYNSQFKAFICAGLNSRSLANWLQLIFRSKQLIEMYYEPWSYALKVGFDDCCKSLEKLNHISFNLPVNIAVHNLQNIKDAF